MQEKIKKPYNLILLILVVIAVFIPLFSLYQYVHPNSDIWIQLWDFFESSGFNIIIIGILVPMLIYLVQFFNGAADERKRIEEKEADEQKLIKEKKTDEIKRLQLKSIEKTQKLWNELFHVTNQILNYSNPECSNIQNYINDLLSLKYSTQDIKNDWYYFDKLSNFKIKSVNCLLKPFDLLLNSSMTVAQFINDNPPKNDEIYDKWLNKEIVDRKSQVMIIERVNMEVYYKAILDILNNYIRLCYYTNNENESKESVESKESIKAKESILKRVDEDVKNLKKLDNEIIKKVDKQKEKNQLLVEDYLLLSMRENFNHENFNHLKTYYGRWVRSYNHNEFVNRWVYTDGRSSRDNLKREIKGLINRIHTSERSNPQKGPCSKALMNQVVESSKKILKKSGFLPSEKKEVILVLSRISIQT